MCAVANKRTKKVLGEPLERVLVVLVIPSVEGDGVTRFDPAPWVDAALKTFGRVFGGAVAYSGVKGTWRDAQREGLVVEIEPVPIHCYVDPADLDDREKLTALADLCRRLRRETRQKEVALIIGDEYFAIRD